MSTAALDRAQARRLAEVYRSSGWPVGDALEIWLLAQGLLQRHGDRLRLSDAGLAALAEHQAAHQFRAGPHEALVASVAAHELRAGRLVWRNLSLRVNVGPELGPCNAARWVVAKPDVFSLVNSSKQHLAHARVWEIKVSRADVLGELRKPLKTAAYREMANELWWVLGCDREGRPIADASEAPDGVGVLVAHSGSGGHRFERLRPARFSAHSIGFAHWMALTQAERVLPARYNTPML